MRNVSIFYLETRTNYRMNDDVDVTPMRIARAIAKRRMKAEGFKFNNGGRKAYLQSEADWLNENQEDTTIVNTAETVVDWSCDNMLYSNAPHILQNRVEVSQDIKAEVLAAMVELFDSSLTNSTDES